MIVQQVERKLEFNTKDRVLDLGCGNGALASRFFDRISHYVGVDFSPYLLEVANEYFAAPNDVLFLESDIRNVDAYSQNLEGVCKILIYGCIAYLSRNETETLLRDLRDRFPLLEKIFIGNIPLREKATEFFSKRGVENIDLDDQNSPIGVWWDVDSFCQLGVRLGYRATHDRMPQEFYGRGYRFDVLLEL